MRVLLLNMPFGPLLTPSLALSTFKPIVEQRGHQCSVRYCNIEFSQRIDSEIYHLIASGLPRAHDLVGEFIFSEPLFGERATSTKDFLEYLKALDSEERRKGPIPSSKNLLQELKANIDEYRSIASDFIRETSDQVLGGRFDLVGFTTAFQQNTASLSLAKALKANCPDLKIVFGGANVEGEMGKAVFRNFEFVDSVVTGEGDTVFPLLLDHYSGLGPHPKRGVISRCIQEVSMPGSRSSSPAQLANLDLLPTPDYSDFMAAATQASLPHRPQLLFETSRGCWWGEKHHCTFCGLNGATMKFRAKTASRALEQLESIAERYPSVEIGMTDNIMDYKYFKDFIPRISEKGLSVSLFYEMKANITKVQIAALSRAGVRNIQPGVESFSDKILKLMDKGITGLQNIQMLKWCAEHGIMPHWNFLLGFPGEDAEEYEKMAKLFPAITHLQPPRGVGRLRIDRFSPYFRNADRDFANVRPFEAYQLVYPLPEDEVAALAYFFDGEPIVEGDPKQYTKTAVSLLNAWKTSGEDSFLFFVPTEAGAICCDARGNDGEEMTTIFLNQLGYKLLLVGDRITSYKSAKDALSEEHTAKDIDEAFEFLLEKRLLISQGDRYLTLAIPAGKHYPNRAVAQRIRGLEAA